MSDSFAFGVIGGSGLYAMEGLANIQHHELDTPFGKPSSPIVTGELAGVKVAFLARHGIGHFITPTEVNYRANVYAMKAIGVTRLVSISACGSLREDYAPGHIVIPDQIFDFTRDRKRSFFGEGMVAHISVADPFCPELSKQVLEASRSTQAVVHSAGTLITIEGPRFSTKAESETYRAWGMSIIGMTAAPEAFLAREAELCYATMAHVTDYDVWHTSESPVTVEMVIQTLHKNTSIAQQALVRLAKTLGESKTCDCENALASALITNPTIVPADTRKNLSLLVDKYLEP